MVLSPPGGKQAVGAGFSFGGPLLPPGGAPEGCAPEGQPQPKKLTKGVGAGAGAGAPGPSVRDKHPPVVGVDPPVRSPPVPPLGVGGAPTLPSETKHPS